MLYYCVSQDRKLEGTCVKKKYADDILLHVS